MIFGIIHINLILAFSTIKQTEKIKFRLNIEWCCQSQTKTKINIDWNLKEISLVAIEFPKIFIKKVLKSEKSRVDTFVTFLLHATKATTTTTTTARSCLRRNINYTFFKCRNKYLSFHSSFWCFNLKINLSRMSFSHSLTHSISITSDDTIEIAQHDLKFHTFN